MKTGFSSGDIMVDRRADYARGLLEAGEHDAACDLMADAMALAPQWAAGWFRLGEMCEGAGRGAAAVEAYARALALDGSDRLGAALKLELLGGEKAAMPAAFIETLFDQYADGFEESLLAKLDYRAPRLLFAALEAAKALPAAKALDLGCGTGLMGERLRPHVGRLEGMDLSGRMLAKASAKGIYDNLIHRDLASGDLGSGYDLAVAADVMMYVGSLENVFSALNAALLPGGWIAFSAEKSPRADGLELRESRRYAHGESLVAEALRNAGFHLQTMETAMIRLDRGQAIDGLIVVARRS